MEHVSTQESTAVDGKKVERRRRRLRRVLVVLALATGIGVAASFVIRSPSPVGHWGSAEGQDRFITAYDEAFAEMPEAEDIVDVRTDFGIVRLYRFSGTGDATAPLVLLPGRSSASPVWADNLPTLLEIADVYTIDLLGEPGMSVQDRPIQNDEDQARWLHQALESLPEEKFHLVGLSIGGWNAVNLALNEPDLIATMSLIEPVFVFGDIPLGAVVRSIPAAISWLPKSWRDSFNSYTAGGAPVEDVPVAEMIEAGMQHYSLKLPQPSRVSEEQLATIDLPVLAILAGDSVMHDPETAAETAGRALTNGTMSFYPGASHALSGEQPEQVATDIAEFISENSPGTQ